VVDLPTCLLALAQQRPLFYLEVDFQRPDLAPAYPGAERQVRQKYRPFPAEAVCLDLWVEMPAQIPALALKYLSLPLTATIGGEVYALTSHAGQPQRRHDFVKDVSRLE
jgi:hypothetical protein